MLNTNKNDSTKTHDQPIVTHSIRNNLTIENLLSRMPKEVADSFSDKQLTYLLTAVGSRSFGEHSIDKRGTLKIPLYKWRIYYILLMGKGHRRLSRKEKKWSLLSKAIFSTIFLIIGAILGLFILYLIKSALGINILPNFSFGIWSWFKELWV